MLRRAQAVGVTVRPLSDSCARPPPPDGLLIGYGAIPTDRVEDGLRRLAECFRAPST